MTYCCINSIGVDVPLKQKIVFALHAPLFIDNFLCTFSDILTFSNEV